MIRMSRPTYIGEVVMPTMSDLAAGRPACLPTEYVVIDADSWDDFRKVARGRGLDIEYSVEDCETGMGIEYHVFSDLDQVEDILWAIQVLDAEHAKTESAGIYEYSMP